MSLQKLIDDIVKAEVEGFYKKFVIVSKGGRENYNTTKEYFEKWGGGISRFNTCWANIEYMNWRYSDTYTQDIETIKKVLWEDNLNGFDSRMEEIINMTDDDDEDFEKWIEMREHFRNLKTDVDKINYLEQQYTNNYYYPNFSQRWLQLHFEDRIVSKI